MNLKNNHKPGPNLGIPATILKRVWQIATLLLLLALIVTPTVAAPLRDDPPPADEEETGEQEEVFDEFGSENIDPVFLPEKSITFAAPSSMRVMTTFSGDLPSYDEEALLQFSSTDAIDLVRYMAEDIGPRLTGTPQELEAAQHFASILESYGYTVAIQTYNQTVTRNVGKVTAPHVELPGGPNWQMSSSTSAKITGDAAPVQAEVIYAGTGQSSSDFPPNTAGKIVMMNYSGTANIRNTAVVNAVNRGAVGVILVQTAANTAPPSPFALSTQQPNVPVVGGGTAHGDWIKALIAEGSLTLTITTNRYINMPIVNVVGVKHAVNDPTGTTAPIVMVGGHIDTVLGAPGASDNASGYSAAVEIARVLSEYALDKEIRIGGWGAEESGLVGANRYVATLSTAERARFVGYWNMDMVASPHAPLRLWALTSNGLSNYVVQSAQAAASRVGETLQNCRLGSSDHVPFTTAGIPASLFIMINYTMPANCATTTGSYSLEPWYHRPADTMDNVSLTRMQTTLNIVGGAVFHSALNAVNLSASNHLGNPIVGATVRADCGEGWRNLGLTDSSGSLKTVIPHATCDFTATAADSLSASRLEDVDIFGNLSLAFPPPPVLAPFVDPNPALLYGSATAYPNVTFSAFDISEASCDAVDTSSLGAKAITCTATDIGGNTATATASYSVIYDWSNFFSPVDYMTLNRVKAGSAIPVKFSLSGNQGLSIFAAGHPRSEKVACDSTVPVNGVEETVSAGGSSLNYDASEDQYIYVWKTDKAWAGTCRQLIVTLVDGTVHTANFNFSK